MTTTLVLPDPIPGEFREKAVLPVETGGVLLVRRHLTEEGDIRLLARSLHWVPEAAYDVRTRREMVIRSEGYVPALARAERDGSIPLWVHTHPGGRPIASEKDRRVDAALSDLFRLRSGSAFYGTVIVSPAGGGVSFTGALHDPHGTSAAMDRLWMVGDRFSLVPAFEASQPTGAGAAFDRNVRAFGEPVQQMISMLRIAVVGAGGTGSAVAEQLVRLGARDLWLVDVDTLSKSNVTRVYGSTPGQVGRLKTDVLAEHLLAIAPDLHCGTIRGMCTTERVARALTGADLIFGCTDDNAGRLVLSRLAAWYLIPVLDLGILLSNDERGTLTGIDGRVTVTSPGGACLQCRGRVDTARAAAEMQTPEERARLADEGYAPALGEVEPAVVAFTTMTAAVAVSELLERLIGYGDSPRPSEVLLRMHEREISTNAVSPRQEHFCDPARGKLGAGDAEPFLERIWVA